MFLLDDVLLAPGKAAFVLFQELARKAQEEWLNDDTIKQELQQLYEMLEGGKISEKDFEAKECRLLERLEQIARIKFQDKWGSPVGPAEQAMVQSEPVVQSEPLVQSGYTVSALPMPALPPALPPAPPPAHPSAFTPPMPQPSMGPPSIAAALPSYTAAPRPPAPPAAPPQAAFGWPAHPYAAAPPAAPAAPAPRVGSAPPMASAPPVAPSPPVPPIVPGVPLTMAQVIDCAVRALSVLKMRVSSITSVMPEDDTWRVSVELVERRGIPDTNDVLGLYELRLDASGNVLRYERTLMRRRCDFSR